MSLSSLSFGSSPGDNPEVAARAYNLTLLLQQHMAADYQQVLAEDMEVMARKLIATFKAQVKLQFGAELERNKDDKEKLANLQEKQDRIFEDLENLLQYPESIRFLLDEMQMPNPRLRIAWPQSLEETMAPVDDLARSHNRSSHLRSKTRFEICPDSPYLNFPALSGITVHIISEQGYDAYWMKGNLYEKYEYMRKVKWLFYNTVHKGPHIVDHIPLHTLAAEIAEGMQLYLQHKTQGLPYANSHFVIAQSDNVINRGILLSMTSVIFEEEGRFICSFAYVDDSKRATDFSPAMQVGIY